MLYLVVQFIFVVLFALGNPAQDVAGMMAVQIYVRNSSSDSRGQKTPC